MFLFKYFKKGINFIQVLGAELRSTNSQLNAQF